MVDLMGGISSSLTKVIGILPGLGLIIVLLLGISLAVFFLYLKPKRYPLVAVLYELIHDAPIFAGIDRAGLRKDRDGFTEYKLLKRNKESIQPVDYEVMIPSKKGTNVIHLLKAGDNSWLPIDVSKIGNNLNFKPINITLKNWYVQTGDRLIRKFQTPDWWKEHKAEVVFIFAIIGTFILYFMMWKYAPGTISSLKSTASTGGSSIVSIAKDSIPI